MLSKIGIGIPTNDRWEDLGVTLQKLEEYGLGDCETIIMDDASREPAPAALRARFPRVRFERSEESLFPAAQRNRLAQMLSTPYFLHLDNDAFPVRGDLVEAVAWLETCGDALGLALIVAELDDFEPRLRALPPAPFPCHYYIGCAALLKRELFLELGGYLPLLHYFCEEIEITLKARTHGLLVYQYPAVVVRHMRSQHSRDNTRRPLLLVRNELLIAVIHYPLIFLLIRWPTFLFKALIFRWVQPSGILRGLLAAIGLLPTAWAQRCALPINAFLAWKRSPSPIKLC